MVSLPPEPLPSFPASLWAQHGKDLVGVFGETIHRKSPMKPAMNPPGKLSDGIYLNARALKVMFTIN